MQFYLLHKGFKDQQETSFNKGGGRRSLTEGSYLTKQIFKNPQSTNVDSPLVKGALLQGFVSFLL